MSNETNDAAPKSSFRKVFRGFLLLLLVVGLPAVSWYYLRNGLNWRLEAKAELGAYGTIPPSFLVYPGNDKVNLIQSSVCVVHNFGEAPDLTPDNTFILDETNKIAENLGIMGDKMVRPNFKLVMLANNGTAEFRSKYQKFRTIDNATWVWRASTNSWTSVLENGYQEYCHKNNITPSKEYFALTDTAGIIVRYYEALNPKEIGRMVEHISLIMPKEGKR